MGTFTSRYQCGAKKTRETGATLRKTYHRDMLEAEEALVTKVIWRPDLAHNNDIFNTNTVFPVGIVARFCALR